MPSRSPMECRQGSSKLGLRMWGYLPASSPQRSPIVLPAKVPMTASNDGWKAACSGGCGFALAISESGKLFTWGSTDDMGQCYYIAGKHQELPEPFPLLTDVVVFAAAGWAHCATVTEDGSVYTWGWKECVPSDRSGLEQTDNYDTHGRSDEGAHGGDWLDSSPSESSELSRKRSIRDRVKMQTARPPHKGAEKADNMSKKRKVADEASSPESSGVDETVVAPPSCVPLPGGVKIVTVATGGRHTLALTDSGQVWGWGYGGEGQLGLGSRMRNVSMPQPIPLDPSSYSMKKANRPSDMDPAKPPGNYIVGIACGGRHSVVVTDGGAVLTFGWGLYGQCGQGSTEDELSPNYVTALGGLHVTGVAAGLWHTLCITSSGDVYGFGGNQFGQLGVGGDQAEMLPRLVEAPVLEDECARAVSCGARHSAICTEKGKAFTWGWNKYGQLGLGDTNDRDTPQEVPVGQRVLNVACGWWHTLALTEHP